jgi:hypothetical protein
VATDVGWMRSFSFSNRESITQDVITLVPNAPGGKGNCKLRVVKVWG